MAFQCEDYSVHASFRTAGSVTVSNARRDASDPHWRQLGHAATAICGQIFSHQVKGITSLSSPWN